MKPPSRIVLVTAAVPLALLLAACGGTNASKSADASGGAGSTAKAPAPADSIAGADGAATGPERDSGSAAKPTASTALQRAVIATGSVQLTTKDPETARGKAIDDATGLGGHVDSEQSSSDRHGHLTRVDLTVRVPSASFEKALDDLGELGTVEHRQQAVQDVTTQVIDNGARIKAQTASVESVEQLLARANTIGEIISIESELARRQADLDSLKQQQRYLADQTSMSTIQVGITRSTKPAHHKPVEARTGFLAGLDNGWHALAATAVALGTVVGALLPFAVVLALIGVPVWLALRRRRTPLAPPPAAEV